MKDLCFINEQLEKRFLLGLLTEELLELTDDAELFHLERQENENVTTGTTMLRPTAFGLADRTPGKWPGDDNEV
jgi:hypothetical protein